MKPGFWPILALNLPFLITTQETKINVFFKGLKCYLHSNFMVFDISYISVVLYLREDTTNAGLWDEFLWETKIMGFSCETLPELHFVQSDKIFFFRKIKPLFKQHFKAAIRLMSKFYSLCQNSFSLQNGNH